MRYVAWAAVFLGIFLAGLFAGPLMRERPQGPEFTPTCRPSSPEKLGGQSAVLFWGNSLAFDGDWPLNGFISVNCAVQGMTADTAAGRTPALPDMKFAAVVLIFGTVELAQDRADPAVFRTALNTITADITQKYPGAQIIVVSIPRNESAKDVWAYESQPHLDAFNDALGQLANVTFIDSAKRLASLPVGSETYERVHLSHQSYLLLNAAIQSALPALD